MAVVLFFDGTTVLWLMPVLLELLELLLLELELLEPDDTMHGGTMSFVTLLFAGTTSWFWGVAPAAGCAVAPPGVTSTVLDAGGVADALLLLELLLLELPGAMQG